MRNRNSRTPALLRALPPDDLDAYEELKGRGFTYDFATGYWTADFTRARVRYLLAAGYRRVD
jgi:hypothetical protein